MQAFKVLNLIKRMWKDKKGKIDRNINYSKLLHSTENTNIKAEWKRQYIKQFFLCKIWHCVDILCIYMNDEKPLATSFPHTPVSIDIVTFYAMQTPYDYHEKQ